MVCLAHLWVAGLRARDSQGSKCTIHIELLAANLHWQGVSRWPMHAMWLQPFDAHSCGWLAVFLPRAASDDSLACILVFMSSLATLFLQFSVPCFICLNLHLPRNESLAEAPCSSNLQDCSQLSNLEKQLLFHPLKQRFLKELHSNGFESNGGWWCRNGVSSLMPFSSQVVLHCLLLPPKRMEDDEMLSSWPVVRPINARTTKQ